MSFGAAASSRSNTHTNATPALAASTRRIERDAWRRRRRGQPRESGLPTARDVVDDIDVADVAAAIGELRREQRYLTLHNILKLTEVLGVDPADLVRGLRAPR